MRLVDKIADCWRRRICVPQISFAFGWDKATRAVQAQSIAHFAVSTIRPYFLFQNTGVILSENIAAVSTKQLPR